MPGTGPGHSWSGWIGQGGGEIGKVYRAQHQVRGHWRDQQLYERYEEVAV